ncbi:transglutaminase-like putative cysteine protease [Neomicrococcus aestuarii]|uniref:Transglutaminase-like putative cysteine protease n=1 Tax=Neomicrococcus aestuarii TaxID=556325 RepID=A0A7W8TS01_9MICC|nr:transglutaminase family protein [Neomicrococcus aestuarii]MBB5511862.1 transglutaminase-like putative cysteine protease [Neomicrococcus aestuarii]
MTRLRIRHRTRYDYDGRVSLSYNEARMSPLTDNHQVVLESNIKVSPHIAVVSNYRDYWGARVTAFDLSGAHDFLEVDATATVEVHRVERAVVPEETLSWEELAAEDIVDAQADYLPQSRLSDPGPDVRKMVSGFRDLPTPHEAAHAVMQFLRENMEYVPGVTGVHTNAEGAWQERRGVCQDLAHVGIGALRSLGIPARYVSGYIHPSPDAGIGEEVVGQSHAWLEWFDGEWRSWDPTNHKAASDMHVSVARGRDYRDVTPLKGIQTGGRHSALTVSVMVTRVA